MIQTMITMNLYYVLILYERKGPMKVNVQLIYSLSSILTIDASHVNLVKSSDHPEIAYISLNKNILLLDRVDR